jgi:hypothetical protein
VASRGTQANFCQGFDLLECDDAKPLTQFALEWSDVPCLQLTPVIEDKDLVEVLKAAGHLVSHHGNRWAAGGLRS